MRIWTPYSDSKEYYLNIFYRENGTNQAIRVGAGRHFYSFGGREHIGELRIERFKIVNELASVEIFPGAVIRAITMSPHPGLCKEFIDSLGQKDEVELVRPSDIAVASEEMIPYLMQNNSFIQKQLSKRKKII